MKATSRPAIESGDGSGDGSGEGNAFNAEETKARDGDRSQCTPGYLAKQSRSVKNAAGLVQKGTVPGDRNDGAQDQAPGVFDPGNNSLTRDARDTR
jgi:hypothetical protein